MAKKENKNEQENGGLLDKIGDTISSVGDKIGETVSSVGDKIGETVAPVAEKVGEAVAPVAERVGDAVAPIMERVGETVSPVTDRVAETLAPVGERVGGAVAAAGDKVSELRPTGSDQVAEDEDAEAENEGLPTPTGTTKGAATPRRAAASRRNGKNRPEEGGYVPRLKLRYQNDVIPAITRDFGYTNPMQVPRVQKVVINIGMGNEARENAKALDNAVNDVGQITGQKAVITRAKKSIAQFKLRTGMPIGVMVTLRGNRMYEFLDKLFNVALARVRDFSGVSPTSFDGRGNFSLGLREQLIFPEIDYDKIDKVRGMEIVIVTSARNDEEGRRLLQLMGMPFQR